jgi:hypothetical protein
MALGISLSCITNLITGDSTVVTWFNSNKGVVIIVGIVLTIASLILSFVSESETSAEKVHEKKKTIKFFTQLILNFFMMMISGLILSFVFYWLSFKITNNSQLSYYITILLIGAIVGSEFKYVGGKLLYGMIVGAFLALAFSYYFPDSLKFAFLPDLLNQKSIISSGIFCGIIGLYTGIYKEEILSDNKNQDESDKINASKESIKFQNLVQFFRLHNYELLSSNYADDILRIQIESFKGNRDMIAAYKKKRNKGTLKDEMSFFPLMKNLIYSQFRNEFESVFRLKFPLHLYDNNLKLVDRFFSIGALEEFIKNNKIENRW